jgi:DNA polymerase-3 subunit delta
MFYILYGPDAFTARETVAAMRARLAEEDPAAGLNEATLDGRGLTLGDMRAASDALPFLGERRLVIVEGLLVRCQGRTGEAKALGEGLKAYLPGLPPTTRLVFTDGPLDAANPVVKWAEQWRAAQPAPDEAAVIRRFEAPKPARLPAWLARRAAARGGEIAPDAADALAEALVREGEVDLGLADTELEKLLTYAGDRAVAASDVALLVTPVSIERVFALLDALSDRHAGKSAAILHRFLAEGEPPLRLLALVSRQFRLLALTRALLDKGTPQGQLASHLPVPPFVVGKLARQARGFSWFDLEAALRYLLKADRDIKTGRIDAVMALDLFTAEVCRPAEKATSVPSRKSVSKSHTR